MAQTIRAYTSDGITTVYPVDFDLGYITRDDVYVYLTNDVYTTQLNYVWINDVQIELIAPLAAGETFNIRRVVERDALVNDYEDGAAMHEGNLDDSFKQSLMIIEEIQDGFINPDGAFTVNSDIDMLGNKVTNLGDAVDDQDAVPLAQMRAYVLDEQGGLNLVNRAEAAAESAEEDAAKVDTQYNDWRDDYMGNGGVFPAPRKEGSLFYYDGTLYTQGLYIHYTSNMDPYTGTWQLISGVGPQGPQGPEGQQGAIGVTGPQGIQGEDGIQGQQGIQGSIGDTGPAGITGATGSQGPAGPQGIVGPEGNVGPQGITGPDGPQGVVGPQGNTGLKGDVGGAGPQGVTGPTGPQGVQGVEGQVGPEGPEGPQGPIGVQGVQGPTGAKGDTGNDGSSFNIDASGLFADRGLYDAELKDFTYYATDYSVTTVEGAAYTRFTSDGVTTTFILDFTPDGPQSVQVVVAGVPQTPDMYEITILNEVYSIVLNDAVPLGTQVVGREFSIATGYGAVFIKESNTSGDWSDAIPFGRGPRGDQGPQGVQGVEGNQGPTGNQGVQGVQGTQGPTGGVGPQGPAGEVGPEGAVGAEGLQGDQGITGPQGPQGIQGTTGPTGAKGAQGSTGLVGPQGPQGDIGPQGQQGPGGDRGPDGVQGPQGDKGVTGSQGPQGVTGATGPQGAQGVTGATGPRGDAGSVGPTGAAGPDGAQGPDGAEGRSSSGKVYDGVFDENGSSTGTYLMYQFPIIVSKPFSRVVAVSGLRAAAFKTGTAAYVKATVVIDYGSGPDIGNVGVVSSAGEGETGFHSKVATVPKIFVDIAAGTTGTIRVFLKATITPNGDSTASAQISCEYANKMLVELVPTSTELGEGSRG